MSDARSLVLVVGVGRSGTSLLSGILGQLGLHIPQPEVKADDTNPRGFGEPRWVVDFHTRLLRSHLVTVNDSRPSAWELTARAAEDPRVRTELRGWLGAELDQHGAIVVKDPRTAWFLPLWARCASELGVDPDYMTMLRHPAETLTSARTSYGTWQSAASRAAAWLNVSLETERATRGARRVFIRYDDLLADWRREITRAAGRLDVPPLRAIEDSRAARVDAFVDPGLHRHRIRWAELDEPVPPRVSDLAERALADLQRLALPDGDDEAARRALDAVHAEYAALHGEAEAIAQSAIFAAKRRPKRKAAAAAPPTLYVRLARRVPKRYRVRARRAVSALRGSGRR